MLKIYVQKSIRSTASQGQSLPSRRSRGGRVSGQVSRGEEDGQRDPGPGRRCIQSFREFYSNDQEIQRQSYPGIVNLFSDGPNVTFLTSLGSP